MDIIKLSAEQVANQYQGFDLYFDRQDKLLYSTGNAIAKWIECDSASVVYQAGKLRAGKMATVPTTQGIQKATLLSEQEIEKILQVMSEGKRTKLQTRQNAKELHLLVIKHGLVEALKRFSPVIKKEKKQLPRVNEISVAQYLKDLHESAGDLVKLQPTIELGYRPDMMIYSPHSDFVAAVEVEPYERRKYGIQQAVTYGKFSNAQPMLVTFGDCVPDENEQLSLSRYRVLWLHIQTKLSGKIENANFISNFSMVK